MCWTDYRGLNYVSLTMVSCATCVSFLLPSVQSAIYFHRQVLHVIYKCMLQLLPSRSQNYLSRCCWRRNCLLPGLLPPPSDKSGPKLACSYRSTSKPPESLTILFSRFRDFLSAFTSPYILKWSIWWALAMCGNYQVAYFSLFRCLS